MDKLGKDTGKGKIRERVEQTNPKLILTADLFNFNIDGNRLKPEHEDYLRRKIVPWLRRAQVHVKLTGYASKEGDKAYNLELSKERVLRVKKFLIDKKLPESKVPGQEMRALGDTASKKDDGELGRRVSVTMALGTKPFPIIPNQWVDGGTIIIDMRKRHRPNVQQNKPPVPGKVMVSREWKIKHLGSAEGGLAKFFGAGVQLFWIVDTTNNREIVCGVPATMEGGVGTPVSISGKGPWTPFRTDKPHNISEFDGQAALVWVPAAVGPYSQDQLKLRVTGISNPEIRVDTGFTFGAGTSQFADGPTVCSDPEEYKPRVTADFWTGKLEYE